MVGTPGIPLGNTDMTPFLSKITGQFDGIFGIFFGPQGIAFVNQSFDLGLSKKYKIAGDGAIAVSTNLPAMGAKAEGFVGIDRYLPVLEGALNTPYHKRFLEESTKRLKEIDPSGPLPDRYVQSNYEAINALSIGMQKSGFRGRRTRMKLIEALEGLEMKESDDFPQGDKTPPQGGPPGLPARVRLRDPGRQVQDPRDRPQGEDDRAGAPASSPERGRERPMPERRPRPRRRGRRSPSCAPRVSACASAASPRSTT